MIHFTKLARMDLMGMHSSEMMYDVTVSVRLSRFSAPALNIFQSVHSKQPLSGSMASVVQDLID